MKVVCINSRQLEETKFQKKNIDIQFWDFSFPEPNADLFVFKLDTITAFKFYKYLTIFLKKSQFDCKVLFYGPCANKNPIEVLNNSEADFVCIGDNDPETILELCQKWGQEFAYDGICGLGNKKREFGMGLFAIFLGNKRMKKEVEK